MAYIQRNDPVEVLQLLARLCADDDESHSLAVISTAVLVVTP